MNLSPPKCLVVTGAEDQSSGDSKILEVFEKTLISKVKYCQKHEYDLLVLNNFKNQSRFKHKHTGFLRIEKCLELAIVANIEQTYEYIFWIDADALITNTDIKIDEITGDNESLIFASLDWGEEEASEGRFSTGNFIIKTNQYPDKFYEVMLAAYKEARWANEQDLLNFVYKIPEISFAFRILHQKYLNSVPHEGGVISKAQRRPISQPWQKGDFLCHLSGIDNKKRLMILDKYFKEYI